ncbi:MAG: PLP-dependent aspartate aminotransferase family protein [Nitrospiraceae bacterium]|nr:PLP-dependent aspartate aminotransferase family protein [Nitrospiraceae bacterium]
MRKETKCVHSGTIDDIMSGGVNSPVFPSTAFNYVDRQDVPYPRAYNTPNQKAVVEKVCALEGAGEGGDGVLFSSGMAAISTAILAFAQQGDHVVLMDELYGGTHSFATEQFKRLGIGYTFAATDAGAICAAIGENENTKVVVIESPTNPLLSVIDIRKVADCARSKNAVTIIDNTFATPVNQNPLKLGVDVVVHSGTKYFGGHSDLCCGVAVAGKENAQRIRSEARHLGGSVNALTCHLIERSLKTLALRVERQSENALRIAQFLENHPKVRRVYYPGLASSPHHEMAKSQMEGFGAMVSFEPGIDAGRFTRNLRIIKPAVSLGGVESTICPPAATSHAGVPVADRQRLGISDSLLRLSVGIEHYEDLIEDIGGALEL